MNTSLPEERPSVINCTNCDGRYLDHCEKCPLCGAPKPAPDPSDQDKMVGKWTGRFLGLAAIISDWSKDPGTKVGAVIVDSKRRVVGMGYNGLPRGVSDTDDRLLDRSKKYPMTVHAEINAVLNATANLEGCALFVWPLHLCPDCAGPIIQAGIAHVTMGVEGSGENREKWEREFREITAPMLEEAGVSYTIIETDQPEEPS